MGIALQLERFAGELYGGGSKKVEAALHRKRKNLNSGQMTLTVGKGVTPA